MVDFGNTRSACAHLAVPAEVAERAANVDVRPDIVRLDPHRAVKIFQRGLVPPRPLQRVPNVVKQFRVPGVHLPHSSVHFQGRLASGLSVITNFLLFSLV